MERTMGDMAPGTSAYVKELKTVGGMRARLMDIGLTGGARVCCLYAAPSGDPIAYEIRGATVALRRSDAGTVIITEGGDAGWD